MRLVVFLLISFTAALSWGLKEAWTHDPMSKMGKYAFICWCLPVAWYLYQEIRHKKTASGDLTLLIIGTLTALAGSMVEMNALKYAGFAINISAILPLHWIHLPYLLFSITWMPVWGWIGVRFAETNIDYLRLPFAAVACLIVLPVVHHVLKKN